MTALAKQDPSIIAQAQAFVNDLAVKCDALQVTTDAEAETAAQIAHALIAQEHAFAAQLEPFKRIKAEAEAGAKPWRACVNVIKDTKTGIRLKIEAYRNRQRAEQTRQLAEATTQAEVKQAVEVLAPKPAGVSEREDWAIEIVDETQIPREYWAIDTARLQREARALKDKFNVPGVKAIRRMVPVFR